jgi:alpha-tubulin suppressor-like RCC1 family protein
VKQERPGGPFEAAAPARVAQLERVDSVALSSFSTCALLLDGSVMCWGATKQGELGRGLVDKGTYPKLHQQPTGVPGIPSAVAVAAGGSHFCVLTATSDRLYCWGSNVAGQVGTHESCTGKVCPRPVPVDLPPEARPVIALALGGQTSCTLHQDGAIYCWGERAKDIAGEGPRRVPGVPSFVEVANGGTHLCGVTKDGSVLCWGDSMLPMLDDQEKYAVECPRCVEPLIKIPGVTVEVAPGSAKRPEP